MSPLQLPDFSTRSVTDIVYVLWRRRRAFTLPALLLLGLAGALALLLPRTYTSSATILVEVWDIPRDLAAEKVAGFARHRLEAIHRRVLTDARLDGIANRFRVPGDRDDIRFALLGANRIDLSSGRPPQVNITFRVSYDGKEPGTVREVAAGLASLYTEENLRRRGEPSAGGRTATPPEDRFSIVEPARLPKRASSPSVPAILLLGFLAGAGVGTWQAFRKEKADNTVGGYEQLTFSPPFPSASGSTKGNAARGLFRHDRGRGVLVATILVSAALVLALVHYFVVGLDVLWGK
jgi:hypothetical protein